MTVRRTRQLSLRRAALLVALVSLLLSASVAAVDSSLDGGSKSKVPGWGIAIIIVGSLAVLAAVIIPITCCCLCDACDKDQHRLPTQYPKTPNPLTREASKASDQLSSSQADTASSYRAVTPSETVRVDVSESRRRASFDGEQPSENGNAIPADTADTPPPMTKSERRRLRRLSQSSTADPEFGTFVDSDGDTH